MRRKLKRFLATGMALAVLATNLTPVSLAAETAAEMQAGNVATQASDVETYAVIPHDWSGTTVTDSWDSETGTRTVKWKIECTRWLHRNNGETATGTETWTEPDSSDAATCTKDKTYGYKSRTVSTVIDGEKVTYTIPAATKTVTGTKTGHDYQWTWTDDGWATVTCKKNDLTEPPMKGEKEQTADEKSKSTKVSCTQDGHYYYHYEVRYDDKVVSSETHDDQTPALGHDLKLNVVMKDSYTAAELEKGITPESATIQCSRGDVDESVNVTETMHQMITAPTCEKEGEGTVWYQATTSDGEIVNAKVTVKLSKLEHNWKFKEFVWGDVTADETPEVKAVYECTNTPDNVQCTETKEEDVPAANLKMTTVLKPGCETKGRAYWTVEYDGQKDTKWVDIDATGHQYGEPSWTWVKTANGYSAVATFTCANSVLHTKIENADVTSAVTTEPTCTVDGTRTYTATVNFNGQDYTDTKDEIIPANGHTYVAEVTKWDEDSKLATVTYTCIACDDTVVGHTVVHENVKATKVDTLKEPTCTETGTDVYRVEDSYGNVKSFSQDYNVTVPALGHYYDVTGWEWHNNYSQVTVSLKCTRDNCGYTTTEETGDVVRKEHVDATCMNEGKNVYVATFTPEDWTQYVSSSFVSDEETQVLPALGHTYGAPEWSWEGLPGEDTAVATVTFTCTREGCTDEDHVVTGSSEDGAVALDYEITVPETCTTAGEEKYTATTSVVSDELHKFQLDEYTDVQTLTRAPLGHSFTDYIYNNDATCTEDGTETAKCDRCDVTDTRVAKYTAGCDLHTVDGAQICAVCGKVNGNVELTQVGAAADADASTIGTQLVVRVGTLPTGKKVITVAFLDNNGRALTLFGSQKIRASLADLQAQLGTTEGNGFEHTLTWVDLSTGEQKPVGFAVENGNVVFDAAFNGNDVCVLLVD